MGDRRTVGNEEWAAAGRDGWGNERGGYVEVCGLGLCLVGIQRRAGVEVPSGLEILVVVASLRTRFR